jgi:hypothetical protein
LASVPEAAFASDIVSFAEHPDNINTMDKSIIKAPVKAYGFLTICTPFVLINVRRS